MAEVAGDAFRRALESVCRRVRGRGGRRQVEQKALVEDGFVVDWVDREDPPPLLPPYFRRPLQTPLMARVSWALGTAHGYPRHGGRGIARRLDARARFERHHRHDRARTVSAERRRRHRRLHPQASAGARRGDRARARPMLATEPLDERHFDHVIAAREGWDYWQQTADGRLLMGGTKRDLELENELTRDDEPSDSIQSRIEPFARTLVPDLPRDHPPLGGSMGFTPDWMPLVGALPGPDLGLARLLGARETCSRSPAEKPSPRPSSAGPSRALSRSVRKGFWALACPA